MLRLVCILWVAVAALIAQPTTAAAQGADAETLYGAGKAALGDERWEDAIAAFSDGLTKVATGPSRWRFLIGMALAHEGRGDLVGAAAYYRAFLHDSLGAVDDDDDTWAARRAAIADDVAALDDRLAASYARLDLQSEPNNAAVRVDGVTLAGRQRTPVFLHLPPGPHEITLTHPDREAVTFSVFLERGQRTMLHKELEAPAPPAPAPVSVPTPLPPAPSPPAPVLPPDETRSGLTPTQIAGLAGIGTGGVAVVVGIGFTVAASSALSELEDLQTEPLTETLRARDRELRDRVPRLEGASVGMYVTGGILAVAGTFMVMFGGDDDEPTTSWDVTRQGLRYRF